METPGQGFGFVKTRWPAIKKEKYEVVRSRQSIRAPLPWPLQFTGTWLDLAGAAVPHSCLALSSLPHAPTIGRARVRACARSTPFLNAFSYRLFGREARAW
jgi:hypothetical protein